MRVLNWNISHGGGSRLAAICQHIVGVDPDLLALTEFQIRNEPALRAELKRLGYPFIVTSNPPDKQNGLLVASKWRLDPAIDQHRPDHDRERWLAVRLDELDLDILVLHVPGATDNKFEGGYGVSGARRKELFWERIIPYATEHKDRRVLMLGDFNTGLRIDAEGTMFKLSHYITELIDIGFVDTWRHLHPDVRGYTWYTKRKDKTTGQSYDLNGFRLDYIFVSPALQHGIAEAAILHEPRKAGASDHASVVVNLNVQQEGAHQTTRPAEISTEPADSPIGVVTGTGDPAACTVVAAHGRLHVRLDLAKGELADMACGVNGRRFVQEFRPTYVTAEWARGMIRELRIWGPQVLKDGSCANANLTRSGRDTLRPAA